MKKIDGNISRTGSIAYIAQQAWIQNLSLRDNILFGKDFVPEKYEKIVEGCSLKKDLEILVNGDETEIGENGINLSGGQKQRINLARAVYSDTDIYLLDDPLSAVDAHVGKHIFDNVIGREGILQDKTRVLVTNSITFLRMVDHIILLKDGEIGEEGTFEELLDKGGHLSDFLIEKFAKNTDDEEVMEIQEESNMKIEVSIGNYKIQNH